MSELPCGSSGMPLRSPELPAPEVSPVWATWALLLGWPWLLGMRIGGAGFGHAHKRDWLLGMRSCLSGALLAFLRSGLVRG